MKSNNFQEEAKPSFKPPAESVVSPFGSVRFYHGTITQQNEDALISQTIHDVHWGRGEHRLHALLWQVREPIAHSTQWYRVSASLR